MLQLQINRRVFFKRTSLAVAATGVPAWFLEQSLDAADSPVPTLANDRPNIALIGCGGMGRQDAKLASAFANVVAVCDVDAKRVEAASQQFGGAKMFSDFRRVLEQKDLHAIINGTPDHWHTLINLAALRAGKDVYSEKPLTLTLDEGRGLVDAVRKSKGVLQTGSQQRSDARSRLACKLVRNGRMAWASTAPVLSPLRASASSRRSPAATTRRASIESNTPTPTA